MFAFYYAVGEIGPGMFDFKRRAWVAYKKTYRRIRSEGGARASASRLRRKPHIRAAIAWSFAKYHDRLQYAAKEPQTQSEIWEILFKAKSDRFRWAPWWVRQQWQAASKNDTA